MPLSSNAPFSEFGQSMILRDIEQLYLTLNGAGTGSAGDGQTQDQDAAVTQTPDLSNFATVDYVDSAIGGIPQPPTPQTVSFKYLSAYGAIGLSSPFNDVDAAYSSSDGADAALLSGKTFTANASGIYTAVSALKVNFVRNASPSGNYQFTTTIDAPYGGVDSLGAFPFLNITATGLTWYSISMPIKAQAVWTGYLSAGQTLQFRHNGNGTSAADAGTTIYNYLNISGVCA